MRSRINSWKTLPPDHKDYVFIYIWGFLWTSTYLVFAPAATYTILGRLTIVLWCVVSGVGALVALFGLLTRDNLIAERLGVTLLMVAPVIYTITQIGLIIVFFVSPELTGGIDPLGRLHLLLLGFCR